MYSERSSKKRGAGCFFLIAIPLTFVILILLLIALVYFFTNKEYTAWKEEFEGDYLQSDYVYLGKEDDLEIAIEEKVDEFKNSVEDVDYVEFTPDEALYLLGEPLESSVPDYIDVERGTIRATDGVWEIYVQGRWGSTRLPWIVLTVEKDNIETAQLYVSSMHIGPYDAEKIGLGELIDSINSGFVDALILVNENDFSGRKFENIELEGESIIIKGSFNP